MWEKEKADNDDDNDYEHDKKASHGGAEAQRAQRKIRKKYRRNY